MHRLRNLCQEHTEWTTWAKFELSHNSTPHFLNGGSEGTQFLDFIEEESGRCILVTTDSLWQSTRHKQSKTRKMNLGSWL